MYTSITIYKKNTHNDSSKKFSFNMKFRLCIVYRVESNYTKDPSYIKHCLGKNTTHTLL